MNYFTDSWNYIDNLIFTLLVVYFLQFHNSAFVETEKIMGSVILVLILYRSFSYLRVIDAFTSIVGSSIPFCTNSLRS
jgi:hypothetical protein